MMKLNKRDQQLADYQKEMKMIGPQLDSPQYKLIRSDVYDAVVGAMVRAFLELNTIRARDGVPYTRTGWRSDVTHEYFSAVVDAIDDSVIALTGKSAHCHPALYGDNHNE